MAIRHAQATTAASTRRTRSGAQGVGHMRLHLARDGADAPAALAELPHGPDAYHRIAEEHFLRGRQQRALAVDLGDLDTDLARHHLEDEATHHARDTALLDGRC